MRLFQDVNKIVCFLIVCRDIRVLPQFLPFLSFYCFGDLHHNIDGCDQVFFYIKPDLTSFRRFSNG